MQYLPFWDATRHILLVTDVYECCPETSVSKFHKMPRKHPRRAKTCSAGSFAGCNTLRRYLHLMGLSDSPLCRRCGAEDETSAHTLCECETLATLRHVYLVYFFLEPEDIKRVSLRASWNFLAK